MYKKAVTISKSRSKCQTQSGTSRILKTQNEDLKDMDVLCTFKIKIESQNSEYGSIKDQCPYKNQDQDAKPKSGTSSTLQSPKSGLKGHRWSLHLENQDREPKFGTWMYQRPMIISKIKSRCKSKSGASSILQILKSELKGYGCSLHLPI